MKLILTPPSLPTTFPLVTREPSKLGLPYPGGTKREQDVVDRHMC